jgi:hypothetical protein
MNTKEMDGVKMDKLVYQQLNWACLQVSRCPVCFIVCKLIPFNNRAFGNVVFVYRESFFLPSKLSVCDSLSSLSCILY